MTAIELTVPCVAAHLLAAGVLRFLPTDADTECETCDGDTDAEDHPCAKSQSEHGSHCNCSMTQDICHWCGLEWLGDGEINCPDCAGTGRRPLRAGDRIAIRADDDVPNAPASLDPWCLTVWRDLFGFRRYSLFKRLSLTDIPLRPGEVVGYATVTNVLPIVADCESISNAYDGPACIEATPVSGYAMYVPAWSGALEYDDMVALSDHVDAGLVFTPGQVALELAVEEPQ